MVAECHPLVACSLSFVLCFCVCVQISHVLYATKCLNKPSAYCWAACVCVWKGDGVLDQPEDGQKRKTRRHGSVGRRVGPERLGETCLMFEERTAQLTELFTARLFFSRLHINVN